MPGPSVPIPPSFFSPGGASFGSGSIGSSSGQIRVEIEVGRFNEDLDRFFRTFRVDTVTAISTFARELVARIKSHTPVKTERLKNSFHAVLPGEIDRYTYSDQLGNTFDGRLEDAAVIARQIRPRGEELGIPEYADLTAGQAESQYHLLLGNRDETLQILGNMSSGAAPRALLLAHLGRLAEAAEILERQVVERPGFGSDDDATAFSDDIIFLDAAILAGYTKATEMLLSKYANASMPLAGGNRGIRCVPQYLGAAEALLGRPEEARKYYQDAIKVCTEMRFRPGLALTRLQLAELLLEHYPKEKKEALEHLDFAIKEFREMKMQPSLERALRHKEILKA